MAFYMRQTRVLRLHARMLAARLDKLYSVRLRSTFFFLQATDGCVSLFVMCYIFFRVDVGACLLEFCYGYHEVQSFECRKAGCA